MQQASIIALFCDDIRSEVSGQQTLVGIMPDNLAVDSFPATLLKLCLYVRFHIYPRASVAPVVVRVDIPSGQALPIGQLEERVILQAQEHALTHNLPYIGMVLTAQIANFLIPAAGRVVAIGTTNGQDYVIGALNVVQRMEPPPT